jgi:hypothetical protein
MLHALRNARREFPDQGEYELTVAIGFARNGVTILEIGYDRDEIGRRIVIHAMKARDKYLRGGVI